MWRGIESTPIMSAAPRRAARRLYYSHTFPWHDSRCPYHRRFNIRHQPSPLGPSLRLRLRYISLALSFSLPLARNSLRLTPTWPTRSLLHPSSCFPFVLVASSSRPHLLGRLAGEFALPQPSTVPQFRFVLPSLSFALLLSLFPFCLAVLFLRSSTYRSVTLPSLASFALCT